MSTQKVNQFNASEKIKTESTENSINKNNIDSCTKDTYNNSKNNKKNYFLTTIKNTSFFVLISLLTKVLNLSINLFVVRKVTKNTYGIVKIYFESAYLMLQYFPLETMRKTTQKYACSSDNDKIENERFEQCSKLMWMLNFIFTLITIPVWYIYVTYGENLSDLKTQMLLHLVSSNLELYIEPICLYCNIKFLNNYKIALVTIGNYTRVFATLFLVVFLNMDLWGFTIARLLSSLMYVSYALYINYKDLKLNYNTIFPFISIFSNNKEKEKINNLKNANKSNLLDGLFNPLLKDIFMSFVYINIIKMILTYTEKIFLSFFIKFGEAEKSEYTFVTDNFAILIRFFLEPLETNFFNLTNKIKTPVYEEEKHENIDIMEEEEDKKEILYKNKLIEFFIKKKKTVKNMINILNLFIRFLLIFGFLLVGYIFVIGKEVFMLVFGSSWATDSSIKILRNYSLYIFIISINGIIEAFCNSISNARQMIQFNKMMILNSIILISLSIFLNEFSVLGLIYANGVAMILRIIGNIYIIFTSENKPIVKAVSLKERYLTEKKEIEKGIYTDFEFLNILIDFEFENIKSYKKSENFFIKISRCFKDCLFTLKSIFIIIICLFLVRQISLNNYFDDDEYKRYLIINNNFIRVLLSGFVFLFNALLIFLFEKGDFIRIYNESV